ncbi:MAG TPA: HAMP domain-containing sensor histidine kinase [Bacteroidales bacterium]|nr:HAMP domain-containing sensor histidine kinase [Bacteroidales bacterium]
MKKTTIRILQLLMVISLFFLVALQLLWLRSEYRSASNSFRREANMVFRSTVQHVTDSLFFNHFRQGPEFFFDSSQVSGPEIDISENEMQGKTGRIKMEFSHTGGNPGHEDSLKRVTRNLIIGYPESNTDSMNFDGENGRHRSHMRFFFNAFSHEVDIDTLKKLVQEALPKRLQKLPFTIIKQEVNWMERGWNRTTSNRNDTLPFTTGFYPLGINAIYAASFENVKQHLLTGLLPQIGFAAFITGLIMLLFILLLKTLLAQQRLLEQKNDFIGNITHELKTPVATVGVALEAMKNFNVLSNIQKANDYIDMARKELDRLSMMTDKILKTSILDYETDIKENLAPVDLSKVAAKVYESFKLISEKNNNEFLFQSQGNCLVSGHEEHLTQILYNLVDNAFKYSGKGSEIQIKVFEASDSVVLTVSDNGKGIAPVHHHKIFTKFYRVPSGNVHTVKGYGLGLNYVEGVVKSHRGKLTLESQLGQGAVFEVRLPKP